MIVNTTITIRIKFMYVRNPQRNNDKYMGWRRNTIAIYIIKYVPDNFNICTIGDLKRFANRPRVITSGDENSDLSKSIILISNFKIRKFN